MGSKDDIEGSPAGELDRPQTEDQITGTIAKVLRKSLKHSQWRFWNAVGVTQSGGCRYEQEEMSIPQPVRILIFARYIAGLEIDASTTQGARELVRLAHLQAATRTQ